MSPRGRTPIKNSGPPVPRLHITVLTAVALFVALLLGSASVLPDAQAGDWGYGRLEIPTRNWTLESAALAKVWESPSLRQNGAKKTTPATTVSAERRAHAVRTNRVERTADVRQDPTSLPERISPRAPPALHFANL